MRAGKLLVLTAFVIVLAYSSTNADEIGWQDSGKGGAVAAGGEKSVAVGISILKKGGNAADAAAATLFALSITDYGWFAIGSEVPFIIYDAKTKQTKVLCGLGGAPLVINELKNRGHNVNTVSGFIARPVMIYNNHDTGIIYAAGDHRALAMPLLLNKALNPSPATNFINYSN